MIDTAAAGKIRGAGTGGGKEAQAAGCESPPGLPFPLDPVSI